MVCGRTKVVCAGGSSTSEEKFLAELYDQIHVGGAAGNATGRNIHQKSLALSTRAALPVRDKMSDTKGECFRVRREGILTRILPEKIMNVPPLPGAASHYFDCSNADEQEKGPYARFNFDVTLA